MLNAIASIQIVELSFVKHQTIDRQTDVQTDRRTGVKFRGTSYSVTAVQTSIT